MKHFLKLLSIFYFLLVFYITFLSRRRNNNTDYRSLVNFDPSDKIRAFRYFQTISEANRYPFLEDIIGNILLFIPLIPALMILFQRNFSLKQVFLLVFSSSMLIESMQFVFNRGIFDVSDIFLNVIGGLLGFCISLLFLKFRLRFINK